tara:strand:- start:132 stop:359 length:228 start_codon:yes stop_codon:yes gene_type:complete
VIDDVEFTYERSWEQIEGMMRKAEKKQNRHGVQVSNKSLSKKERMYHARNYKALEGVIKSLRWVLGDKVIQHPLE